MKAVIMAGGSGTRIAGVYPDIPKPMINVGGKPILQHTIENLVSQGITDITITVSYLRNKIMDYFGDGRKWGAKITYFEETVPLGNAGALFELNIDDDILLINGDIYFDVNLNKFIDYHHKCKGKATIITHPNSHPYDSALICTNENGKVIKWLSKDRDKIGWYKNRVNAGIHILAAELFYNKLDKEKIDLDKDILMPLVDQGNLYSFDTTEYIKDMGTPERLNELIVDYEKGIPKIKSLENKQRAVFLDRDGTINRYVGFLTNIEDFQLNDNVGKAIREINRRGYLVIVITNQPVIARGEVSVNQLDEIHNKMETLLGEEGAYIDKIYYCPHHPDKGYKGEIKSLKIECDCRKPKPGLINRAAQDFNINLKESWMIGDSDIDIQAGINAGCKTMKVKGDLLETIRSIFDD